MNIQAVVRLTILDKIWRARRHANPQPPAYKETDFDLADIRLKEGQELEWFAEGEWRTTSLPFDFDAVVQEFFAHFPT